MERKAVTYENYFPAYHQWPINTALEHKMFIYLKNELTKMIKDFASTIEVIRYPLRFSKTKPC